MIYQRMICYRFKPGTTEADIQAHMNALQRLGELIEEILGYQGGRAVSGDFNQPPVFDSMHYMTFRNQEAIQVYFDHPAHQQFITNHRDIWEDVLVLNGPVEVISDSPAQQPEPDEY
jgi:hypothetical protein